MTAPYVNPGLRMTAWRARPFRPMSDKHRAKLRAGQQRRRKAERERRQEQQPSRKDNP